MAIGCFFLGGATMAQPVISSTRIWNKAPHNAFTSLIEYQGNLYCAFREGLSHVNKAGGDDGRIRILKSKDGNQWKSVGLLYQKGLDFRDPFLSITKSGELMVSFGGVKYHPGQTTVYHTYATIFKRGRLLPIYQLNTRLKRDWLWRIRWYEGKAYSFNYLSGFRLMKSDDGKLFDTVKRFSIPLTPSEADFVIKDNHVFVVLRRNDTDICLLGFGSLDGNIKWKESPLTFYGPNLLQLMDGKVVLFAKTLNKFSKQKELGVYQYINNSFIQIASFPFRGDGGYCGSIERRDSIYVTYYSSHINKQSAVYLAVIPKSYILNK
ncbi:MAG: hypothetical protein IK148_02265 [Prevotella sp.]|nr:hypothetical protein [Prevotella sp.]